MAILERDLKLLWGRAAGRCSMCKALLTEDKVNAPGSFVLGEMAHIIAERLGGPRGDDELSDTLRNNYLNLILLCPTCHTKVDKAPEDYPQENLARIKAAHEAEMRRLPPSDKASYDESLHFSRVTAENWQSPDRENYIPIGVSSDQWIAPFLQPRLDKNVPIDVIRAFEVARSCMIYSWFFYPMAALGIEQVMRVGKLAVRERCVLLGKESDDFNEELNALVAAGVLTPEQESQWQALGRLTEDRGFLAGATLLDPGQAVSTLWSTAVKINALFSKGAGHAQQATI